MWKILAKFKDLASILSVLHLHLREKHNIYNWPYNSRTTQPILMKFWKQERKTNSFQTEKIRSTTMKRTLWLVKIGTFLGTLYKYKQINIFMYFIMKQRLFAWYFLTYLPDTQEWPIVLTFGHLSASYLDSYQFFSKFSFCFQTLECFQDLSLFFPSFSLA